MNKYVPIEEKIQGVMELRDKCSNPDELVAVLRASGVSVDASAKILGVSNQTISRRAGKPHVRAMVEQLTNRLADLLPTIAENSELMLEHASDILKEAKETGSKSCLTENHKVLALADKVGERIGQSLGLFPGAAPSSTVNAIIMGGSDNLLSDSMLEVLSGKLEQQAIDVEVMIPPGGMDKG